VKRSWLTFCLIFGLVTGVSTTSHAAPPQGMPDPTEMSGIPRPDPNLAPDVVTIRCLDGSFANPALGVVVELELTAPDGTKTSLTATSAEQGRARFEGLSDHYGHTAIARATVAGQALTSQTFTLTGQTGFALMLVATGTGQASPPANDPHGGQGDVPMPGKPFALAEKPRGSLIVGALDLSEAGGPIAGIEITLRATVPGVVEPIIQTATTDVDGRATFDNLDTTLPEGAAIVVSADLGEGELERSQSFVLGETGYAIVLTRNEKAAATPPPRPAAPERQVVFPPRADRSLPPGQIRVLVIGADDRPITNHPISARATGVTGDEQIRSGTTDAAGQVILEFPADASDLLAQVHTNYGGAPWTSGGFSMPSDSGAIAILRVFETTADRSIARSAIQIDVVGRENDFAAVTFMVAVFIEGDLAYWPGGGMRIFGPEGTRSLHVLPEAETWLVHDGEAPWVDLAQPLPPGVEIRLSFAVGLEHDGSLELDWTTPFPLVDDASLVTVPPDYKVSHGVAGAPETNPHAGRDGGPLDIYRLGHERFQAGVCDRLGTSGLHCPFHAQLGNDLAIVVEGLPIRSRVWPWTAWILLGLTGSAVLLALTVRRRVGVREALIARRDALMIELLALDQAAAASAEVGRTRTRLLASLDRIYRQLDAMRS
jgi:5-hydroxyisourate hydrolase-like protein (transthyretin family)